MIFFFLFDWSDEFAAEFKEESVTPKSGKPKSNDRGEG